MPEMTREEVLEIVHRHIDGVKINDCTPDSEPIHLTIVERYVERTPYSWRVPVRPSREPLEWACIYDRNADIAQDIAWETGLNIIFRTYDVKPSPAELVDVAA